MKHSFLTTLLIATIVSGTALYANAQTPTDMPDHPAIEHKFNHEEMQKKMTEKLTKELGLTDEQQEQSKAIHDKGKADMEPLMKEMKDLREKMDAVRKANMEEFEKILTPEQKQKFEEMKSKGPHTMHHKFGKKGPFKHKAPEDFEIKDAQ